MSTQTAARAVISSASRTSSGVNGSGRRNRVSTATPRVRPRARIGTDIVEWMPYSLTRARRARSRLSQASTSPEGTEATTVRPAVSEAACGDSAG